MAKTINSGNFEQEVLKCETAILVDFWATWCGPCKMMLPVMEELKADFEGSANIIKLDVDENQEISSAYGVRTLPAFFVFKDGDVVAQFSGPQSKDTLADAVRNA